MSMSVDPMREAFDAFKALPRDQPVAMLNLIRFRERAAYPPDHELAGQAMGGAEAYRRYGEASGPVFTHVGGTIVWRGRPELVLIGPADERWDSAFLARYPTAAAFLEMVTDDDYRRAVLHRQAAVADSRLLRCSADEGTSGGFA